MKTFFSLLIFMAAIIPLKIFAQQKIRCATDEYRAFQFQQHPELKAKYEAARKQILNYAFEKKLQKIDTTRDTVMARFIPVVVHVVYYNTTQNISDAQIKSQIAVLNSDYLHQNIDTYRTRDIFKPLAAQTNVQFFLARVDEQGNPTTGIVRKPTKINGFAFSSNQMKHDTITGEQDSIGNNAWNTDHYLNIWICNLTGGVLGFTTLPGDASPGEDGVVIGYNYFGEGGAITDSAYNLGRTATHEIGHYLGLLHPFDGGCTNTNCTTDNDGVCDTPPCAQTFGCNPALNTCHTESPDMPDMIENFMCYTDDSCMNMFSLGQNTLMQAALNGFHQNVGYDSQIVVINIPVKRPTASISKEVIIKKNFTDDNFIVQSFGKEIISSVQILNINGQLVADYGNLITTNQQFDISNLQVGLYIVAIKTNNNLHCKKVIKF